MINPSLNEEGPAYRCPALSRTIPPAPPPPPPPAWAPASESPAGKSERGCELWFKFTCSARTIGIDSNGAVVRLYSDGAVCVCIQ